MRADGDEFVRGDVNGGGAGHEVGFMRLQKRDHGIEQCGIVNAAADLLGIKAREREQPMGAVAVFERPGERAERNRLRPI